MYTRGLLPSAASKAEVGAESCIQAGAPQEPLNWDGATRVGDGNGLEGGSPILHGCPQLAAGRGRAEPRLHAVSGGGSG